MKSVQIRSFSGPYILVTGIYGPEETPYLGTFHAVSPHSFQPIISFHIVTSQLTGTTNQMTRLYKIQHWAGLSPNIN